ncbi:MAG TPA: SRPBCC domain-containing protein [Thermoanaerobaculaceae bacterium]|nr:SRPBCC domain-containing protein [Thermoanaerobaculaceae bacterium]
MTGLTFSLERTIVIRAPRELVFRYFTDPTRFAAWWGAGSEITARPGGAVRIRYPNGVLASGEVVEVAPPARIVFTYGYEGADKPIAPGGSRVTIELAEDDAGTRLHLRHDVASAAVRDEHAAGWRYQLALFANVASNEAQRDAAARVDAFLAAWSETDAAARRALLEGCAAPAVTFRDAFACVAGIAELDAHIAASQDHMPGVVLSRAGEVRHCQGTAVTDWVARRADGVQAASGSNVFELAPDGRITSAVGLWSR